MAKLLTHEQVLQEKIEEVTGPLTDLLDTFANIGMEDGEDLVMYREEAKGLAQNALEAWDDVAAALRRLAGE